jgi:NitT/TauT family transport system permease protein/taurine transport system permease protein
MRWPSPTGMRWIIIAVIVVLWEALPRAGIISQLFIPPLSLTILAGIRDWPEYADALATTLREVAAGMLFACGCGVIAGAVLGSMTGLRRLLLPLASGFYAIPIVILYPVLTAWLGIGSESKIVFGSVIGFFPTMLATAAGIQAIEPQYLLMARSVGASLPQRIAYVVIPASLPTVLTGVRLGGALVIVGVVVAEMLLSTAGVGYLITRYRTVLDSEHVFVAVLLVLAMAVSFDLIMRFVERKVAARQSAARRDTTPEA